MLSAIRHHPVKLLYDGLILSVKGEAFAIFDVNLQGWLTKGLSTICRKSPSKPQNPVRALVHMFDFRA